MDSAQSDARAPVRAAFAARRDERSARSAELRRSDRLLSHLRLLVAGALVVVAWIALVEHAFSPGWIAWPILLFAELVRRHHRVLNEAERAERGIDFCERALARLEDRWPGGGSGGERFLDPEHPYAADLDLFGEGSVFELLCRARTGAGEQRLAEWLLSPAHPDTLAARREASTELAPRVDLREELHALGALVEAGVHPDALRRLGSEAPPPPGTGLRVVAFALPLATIAGVLIAPRTPLGPYLPLALVALQSLFARTQRARVRATIDALARPAADLELLGRLLAVIAQERFEAAGLRAVQQRLVCEGRTPDAQIRALRRLAERLDARLNPMFAPIGALLLWTTQTAFAIDAWRARVGPMLGTWLDATAEFEALVSLAGHAHENPDDVFAEIGAGTDGARLDARAVGHPLLPRATCVRNDVALGGEDHAQVLLVSGSNMSGKSTLLRTLGVNVVLAQAGAPVRAGSLRMSPLAVGASIRAHDSIREGVSRFYAEISRIRDIVALGSRDRPLLFLLDEVLQGTNSHDRRIGAEAIVRGLVDTGAIGLATTHDLALTGIVELLGPRATNVHFEDQLVDGRMVFDYRLRDGVVTHSNALALLESVGLYGKREGDA